jgi:chemotaxis protein CheD
MSAYAATDESFTRHLGQNGQQTRIRINPGGHYVTGRDEMLVTVLGSCVAACIRDPVARIGGMNHFMLPQSDDGAWGIASASLRFGNFAMERLINDILGHGGFRQNLEIKVFGGASIIGNGAQIGLRNAEFVETYLREERLPIAAANLRGAHARCIHYYPHNGLVRMLEMPRVEPSVAEIELNYVAQLRTEPVSGSVELFEVRMDNADQGSRCR